MLDAGPDPVSPRDLDTLIKDGETRETIASALAALAEIEPTNDLVARDLEAMRDELLQELRTMEGMLL